jgi:membrane fusion protein, multidrug efflux system
MQQGTAQEGRNPAVRVTLVQHALSADTNSLTGQIQAKDQFNLAFRIGGRLQERSVTVGDSVAPGQIVARIEPQDFQNALRSAEADLASAQAVLANAQATEGRQSELLSKGFATPDRDRHLDALRRRRAGARP